MQKQKDTGVRSKRTPAEEIADHISALLSNPATPAGIHNALMDALQDTAGEARVGIQTPEVLRVAMPLIIQRLNSTSSVGKRTRASKQEVGRG
ncbi:MAG: hypothetical protein M3362_19095 [Acidobacteriota bacterium]|nr:hypothetical protein [Acidobacteriota bacterium]